MSSLILTHLSWPEVRLNFQIPSQPVLHRIRLSWRARCRSWSIGRNPMFATHLFPTTCCSFIIPQSLLENTYQGNLGLGPVATCSGIAGAPCHDSCHICHLIPAIHNRFQAGSYFLVGPYRRTNRKVASNNRCAGLITLPYLFPGSCANLPFFRLFPSTCVLPLGDFLHFTSYLASAHCYSTLQLASLWLSPKRALSDGQLRLAPVQGSPHQGT